MSTLVVFVFMCMAPVLVCISYRREPLSPGLQSVSSEMHALIHTLTEHTTTFKPLSALPLLDPDLNCGKNWCGTVMNDFITSIFDKARMLHKGIKGLANSVSLANVFDLTESRSEAPGSGQDHFSADWIYRMLRGYIQLVLLVLCLVLVVFFVYNQKMHT